MKQLKSRSQDLRSLFENSITIEYVVEPLKSFDSNQSAQEIFVWMQENDFDVVGVKTEGIITGYLEKNSLNSDSLGDCKNHEKIFLPQDLIAISTPLIKLLPLLKNKTRLFILDCNSVTGIVTQGDLQKSPVRMLLFGLVSLLEMNLLRIIRLYYSSDDSLGDVLTEKRLKTADELLQERRKRNEAMDLFDCLQFCDKRDLILHNPDLIQKLALESKNLGKEFFKKAEDLRNNLAHAQDLVGGSSWFELISLAEGLEKLLILCEQI
jgi:predicted transcriptional regulator